MALRLALVLLLRALLVQSDGHEIIEPDLAYADEMKQIIIDPDHIDEGNDIMLTANQSAALNLERTLQEEEIVEIDDLLLTGEQVAAITSRKAVSNIAKHWPDQNGFPHVPYTYEDTLVNRTAVELAIQHWRDNTCITFTEVPSTSTEPRFRFTRHASACNSFVGYINRAEGQVINVPEWCEESFGSLVHEIGHGIGFWHEQSRSDRDTYVGILTHNIRAAALGNFDLSVDNPWGVPYDYKSDMHYSGKGFTKNGLNTIVTKDPRYQSVIGQRTGLSHMDKLLANTMYGCTEKLLSVCSLTADPCQNYGYLGKDCNCVCPEGTSGSNCESLDTPYNDVGLSPNTEIITAPTTITTEGYPSDFPLYSDFVKWIKAPACKLIKITFTDFELYKETTRTIDGVSVTACWYDFMEIRTSNMLEGEWFCGTSIAAGREFTSTGNEAVIYFQARTNFNRGFSADVTFIDNPSCTTTSTSTSTTTSTTESTSTSTTTTSTSTTSTTTTTTSTSTTTTSTSTTTTTTSTSTTTTSTSTTTTTTSTSTTTTSTSTTTTTTTSTTTTSIMTTTSSESSWDPCVRYMQDGYLYLTSPNFPSNYPNNVICTLANITDELGLTIVDIKMLRLFLGDLLTFENPYTAPRRMLFRFRPSTVVIPSAQFLATFTSNSRFTWRGFNLRLQVKSDTGCHQKLSATNGGVITSPGFPNAHPRGTYCEWHITASEGKKVLIDVTHLRIRFSNFLAVNPTTELYYRRDSVIYLPNRWASRQIVSSSNLMRIFFAGKYGSRGFRIEYSEVEDI
ncbi:protein SpAN-like isoform X2 [Penaeus indicus]|uniref:protein SpAN-like isoform X2 n=1 Tax=Penaeus indicus TaxID=29960 RepID=UPI00300D75D8